MNLQEAMPWRAVKCSNQQWKGNSHFSLEDTLHKNVKVYYFAWMGFFSWMLLNKLPTNGYEKCPGKEAYIF